MPLFKTRNKRVEPLNSGVEEILLESPPSKPNMGLFRKPISAPLISTLKFQLRRGLDLGLPRRMDDPEEVVECMNSIPPCRNRHRHSVTLPMDLPVMATSLSEFSFRRGTYPALESSSSSSSSSPKQSRDNPGADFQNYARANVMAVKLNDTVKSAWLPLDECDEVADHNTHDDSCSKKWFQDIDKLTNFKSKHKFKKLSVEQTKMVVEWTCNPHKFYECILNLRRKRSADEFSTREEHEISDCPFIGDEQHVNRVCFAPEIVLFSAIEENLYEEVELVIKTYQIDLNAAHCNERFPLHRAAQLGFTDCARILLKHGANVNSKNLLNHSPLYVAYSNRQFECIVLFIEAGANIQDCTSQRLLEFKNVQEISKTCYRAVHADV